jgi:hypothetical protein
MIIFYECQVAEAVENFLFHWGEMVAFMEAHDDPAPPTKEELAQWRRLSARVERERRLLIKLLT